MVGKHFTNFIYDNGGGVRLFSSSGWEGDEFVWSRTALTAPLTYDERFAFERKSAKEFVVTWETRKPQADWAGGDRPTCNK
jgi:hypothetical protein